MDATLTAGPLETAFHLAHAALVAGVRLIDRALLAFARGIWNVHERMRERAKLAELDTHLLRDMGLTACDVAYETNKPLWMR